MYCRDGNVFGWSKSTQKQEFKSQHFGASGVVAVDVYREVVISGHEDGKLAVTSFHGHFPHHTIFVADRLWSLAVQPLGYLCCTGTAGYNEVPLHLYDLEQ